MRAGRRRLPVSLVCILFAVCLLSGCVSGSEAANVTEQEADQIAVGDVELEVEQIEYGAQVEPPEPIGYYNYYPEREGCHYLIVSGTARNLGDTDFDPESCYVEVAADGNVREGKIEFTTGRFAEFTDMLSVHKEGVTWKFYLFAVMKEDEEADTISIFYNDDFSSPGEDEPWDQEIRISL